MNYCSKCGQAVPKPWFRIVNSPAALLFVWPALDFLGYAIVPHGPDFLPYLHGTTLAVGAVFTAALYAWIAISGR
jgi:hypothetical protein